VKSISPVSYSTMAVVTTSTTTTSTTTTTTTVTVTTTTTATFTATSTSTTTNRTNSTPASTPQLKEEAPSLAWVLWVVLAVIASCGLAALVRVTVLHKKSLTKQWILMKDRLFVKLRPQRKVEGPKAIEEAAGELILTPGESVQAAVDIRCAPEEVDASAGQKELSESRSEDRSSVLRQHARNPSDGSKVLQLDEVQLDAVVTEIPIEFPVAECLTAKTKVAEVKTRRRIAN
jgi:hypothetical protein